MYGMNDYLNYTETKFKQGLTFKDYADSKKDPFVKAAIDFNYKSDTDQPEVIVFSCNSNKKSSKWGLGQF
jgi:hypothetical protein